MIERCVARGPAVVALVATSLVATVAVSAISTSLDALAIVLLVLLLVAAIVAAIVRPILLFYVYCATIPLNDVLPPGPVGTVARIAGLAFFLGYIIRQPNCLRPGTVPLVGWAFVGWALASCLWAVDTEVAFRTWLSLAQLFAITVLIASLVAANPRIVRNALWSYTIPATVTAVVAIFSSLQGLSSVSSRAAAFEDQNPAAFASLILPAIIFLMSEVQSRTTPVPQRALVLAALVACIVSVLLSGTRSAWVGITVATVVWLLLQREPRQILAIVALAFGAVILAISVPGAADFLAERALSSVETEGSGRADIWAVGLGIVASAPLIGVGFGNFPLAFTPYAIAQVAGADVGGAGRGSHNVLLGAFAETGVVGGILAILFFASALAGSNKDRLSNVIRVAVISLLAQSFFTDILLRKQLWLFVAIAFGLAAAQRVSVLSAAREPRLWPPRFGRPYPRPGGNVRSPGRPGGATE